MANHVLDFESDSRNVLAVRKYSAANFLLIMFVYFDRVLCFFSLWTVMSEVNSEKTRLYT